MTEQKTNQDTVYLWHPESDSYLAVTNAEWKELAETPDGGLCVELTKEEWGKRTRDLDRTTAP